MLAKPQGFPRKLGGCAGLDPRLRSAVSAGVGDGERGLRRGLRAPGVGVRPKWVLEYSPSNKRIRYFVSITYVRTGLWTAHKFCGGGEKSNHFSYNLRATKVNQSTETKTYKRIQSKGRGWAFSQHDFALPGSRSSIDLPYTVSFRKA